MKRLVVVLALVATACANGAGSTTTAVDSTTTTQATTPTSTPTTTTTQPSTTTTTVERPPAGDTIAGTFEGTVGYVGCSMSKNAVEGYDTVGGANMWSFRAPYGGGTIGRWNDDITSDRGNYWGGFDKELDLNPETTMLWWNLCTVKGSPQDSYEHALLILDEIQQRIPGVAVYVSAQPAYTGDHVCALAGPGGPEKMQDVAAQLVAAGVAQPGPVMGPLDKSETRDGCHANDQGMAVLGQQLFDFFG
jgi:hypothetical protein